MQHHQQQTFVSDAKLYAIKLLILTWINKTSSHIWRPNYTGDTVLLNKSNQRLPNTPVASIGEWLANLLRLGVEHEVGHRDPILMKRELSMMCNLLNV